MFRKTLKIFLSLCAVSVLAGCDSLMNQLPLQQLGPREKGVVFRRLPTFLGGGVATKVHPSGALVVVWPWDAIYRIDLGSRDVALGEATLGAGSSDRELGDFLFTRANDGNEVALKMTVRYRVRDDEDSLVRLIQNLSTSNEGLQQIVVAVSRAAVRQYMNELRTSGFLKDQERYGAVDRVRAGIQSALDRLLPDGVEVMAVMLDRFEFARMKPSGDVDRSYQEKLNEVLRVVEQTGRERLRIETVKAEGELKEFNTQALVNRLEQEALGMREQAIARGDGYLTRKQNEAKSILALGTAEVQGIIEKVNALEGPGGAAILRLELAKALLNSDSRFVLMGSGSGGQNSMEVQRVDANALLGQLGILEAMRDSPNQGASQASRAIRGEQSIYSDMSQGASTDGGSAGRDSRSFNKSGSNAANVKSQDGKVGDERGSTIPKGRSPDVGSP